MITIIVGLLVYALVAFVSFKIGFAMGLKKNLAGTAKDLINKIFSYDTGISDTKNMDR